MIEGGFLLLAAGVAVQAIGPGHGLWLRWRERREAEGARLRSAYPVDGETPADMLGLLGRID